MAIKLVNNEWCGCVGDYINSYIVDTQKDVANLPECCTGSSALVVETGEVYVMNASNVWTLFGG